MAVDKFTALISDYCQQAGSDAAAQILQGAPMEVDGVLFALTHDKSVHPGLAYVYCDLGLVPEGRTEETCRLLLELNMTLHPATGRAMMISPATSHILLAACLPLRTATVEKLDGMLMSLVTIARNWRKISDGLPAHGPIASPSGGNGARHRIMRELGKPTLQK